MRVPTAPRRRRGFRVRGWIIAGVILLVILLFSLRGLAGFYTDFLWFDPVGQGSTWRELLSAKVVPALVFTLVFFVIMLTSLLIADRLAPKYRSMGPEDELVERYQQFVSSYQGRIRVGVSLFFALIAGVGVASQWQEWVLFTHRVDFGVKDAQFNKDIGFYVFQLPFLRFIAAGLFIWNIWRRGWVLPIIAVGLWGFVSIVIGTIYPAGVQKFRVEPNEFQNEQQYIDRNIAATRDAFGLAKVQNKDFDYQQNLDATVVNQNIASIDNARLWDPNVIQSTYQSLQGLQTFYKIDDVDIDRYQIGDQMRQVVLSAREINQGELPSQSWVNQHLVYTHGYGIVSSPASVSRGTRSSTPTNANSTTRGLAAPTRPPATPERTASSSTTSSAGPRSR